MLTIERQALEFGTHITIQHPKSKQREWKGQLVVEGRLAKTLAAGLGPLAAI